MSIESNIMRMYQFNETERAEFQSEYDEVKLSLSTAIKLAIFTGFVGGHHFYLKRIPLGLACLFFFWTFIPAIAGWIEVFFLPDFVREINEEHAVRIANSINLSRQLRNPDGIVAMPGAPVAGVPAMGPVERVVIKEIVKIPCRYCGSLIENTSSSCPNCGGSLS